MADVWVGFYRVFAKDVKPLDLPLFHGMWNLGRSEADLVAQWHTPGLFKLFNSGRVGDLLIGGEIPRQTAHVAGALHVILSTDGVDATALFAQLTDNQGEVGHAHYTLGTSGVLCNTQAVDNGSLLCLCIESCRLTQVIGINATNFSHSLGGVLHDNLFECLKVFGLIGDVVHVL